MEKEFHSSRVSQRPSESIRPFIFFFIPMIVFWLLLWFAHIFDWHRGTERGTALLALLGFILLRPKITLDSRNGERLEQFLPPLALILFGVSVCYLIFGRFFGGNDIAESTVRAIGAILNSSSNPYADIVDEVDIKHPEYFFEGYKYLPLMFLIYMPAVAIFSAAGIYITNFVFFCGTIWIIFNISLELRKKGFFCHPLIPVVLYMASLTVLHEYFVQGTNDVITVFFALAALLALLRQRELEAALLLGCAIATKWPVGGLFLLVLLPQARNKLSFFLWASVIPLITITPFLLWDFGNFASNTFFYWQLKEPDSTAFVNSIPLNWLKQTVRIALFAIFWVVWLYYVNRIYKNGRSRDGRDIIVFLAILTTIFLLIPEENHRNHITWLIPILALAYGLRGPVSAAAARTTTINT